MKWKRKQVHAFQQIYQSRYGANLVPKHCFIYFPIRRVPLLSWNEELPFMKGNEILKMEKKVSQTVWKGCIIKKRKFGNGMTISTMKRGALKKEPKPTKINYTEIPKSGNKVKWKYRRRNWCNEMLKEKNNSPEKKNLIQSENKKSQWVDKKCRNINWSRPN